jgi:Tfp pilus assembly protein PilN
LNRLGINLATRPFRNNAMYWIAFLTCGALLSLFTWYNVHQYHVTEREVRIWSDRLRNSKGGLEQLSSDAASMTAGVRQVDLKALNDRSTFVNGIIMSRLFSWTQLFDKLESVLPENVRVKAIRPAITHEGIEVTVDAVAKDFPNLLKFEKNLLDSDSFKLVYPLQESTKEGQGEITFNLSFGYVPQGRAEAAGAPESKASERPAAAGAPAARASAPKGSHKESAGPVDGNVVDEDEVMPDEEDEPDEDANTPPAPRGGRP